jgi:carbon-monoxide dehydrogenase small subunit
MPEKDKNKIDETSDRSVISRREFLKDAGLVVGGASLGSVSLLNACTRTVGTTTVTETNPITKYADISTVPPITVTTTVSVYIDPIDGTTWPTLDTLKAHFAAAHPQAYLPPLTNLIVNGTNYGLQVQSHWTLVWVLREKLGLTGTKKYCNLGSCGFCNVIMDGRLVMSCMVLASECNNSNITTVEGLATGNVLHPIQQAVIDAKAFECGMCTPGVIMAAKALLDKNKSPTLADIQEGMSGAFCRCAQYDRIFTAVSAAAVKMKG